MIFMNSQDRRAAILGLFARFLIGFSDLAGRMSVVSVWGSLCFNFGSSAKPVGELWLGQVPKLMQ